MTTTFSDLIERAWRRIMGPTATMACPLSVDYTAGSSQMILTGPQVNTPIVGGILAVDLEIFYLSAYDPGSGIATVSPGYQGSTRSNHSQGTLAYIQPRITRFDISVAINDALNEMSSPTNGMGQIPDAAVLTYNPVYLGYDLGALPENFTKVLEVRKATLPPYHDFPLIPPSKWKVARNLPDPAFPSGAGIILYEGAYPGRPIYVSYLTPYNPLVNLTDDVTVVAGLQATAIDIPSMGAEIALTIPQEIRRNFTDAQPDARKAQEVPPGAISNSASALLLEYYRRIDDEAKRIDLQYSRQRW